jgi:hypothetical protein
VIEDICSGLIMIVIVELAIIAILFNFWRDERAYRQTIELDLQTAQASERLGWESAEALGHLLRQQDANAPTDRLD